MRIYTQIKNHLLKKRRKLKMYHIVAVDSKTNRILEITPQDIHKNIIYIVSKLMYKHVLITDTLTVNTLPPKFKGKQKIVIPETYVEDYTPVKLLRLIHGIYRCSRSNRCCNKFFILGSPLLYHKTIKRVAGVFVIYVVNSQNDTCDEPTSIETYPIDTIRSKMDSPKIIHTAFTRNLSFFLTAYIH